MALPEPAVPRLLDAPHEAGHDNRIRTNRNVLLPRRNVAHEIKGELALFAVAGHLDNRLVEPDGEILFQPSTALRRGTCDREHICRFGRQQAHGGVKIVTRVSGNDGRMVDLKNSMI